MIIRNAVPPMMLATILGLASQVAADAKPIRGTGQTFEPLRQIDHPIAFRNEVTAR